MASINMNGPIHTVTDDMKIAPDEEFVEINTNYRDKFYLKEYYLVSNYGRIFNKYTNKFIRPRPTKHSELCYLIVAGKRNTDGACTVPYLIMSSFHPEINYKMDRRAIVHKNGDNHDNRLENLAYRWMGEPICPIEFAKKPIIIQPIYFIPRKYTKPKKRRKYAKCKNRTFRYEEIKRICEYYQERPMNPNLGPKRRVAYYVQMLRHNNYFGRKSLTGLLEVCHEIHERKVYTNISSNYNF